MINKLRADIESGSDTVEIPNQEATRIFRLLMAVSDMLDGTEQGKDFQVKVPVWLWIITGRGVCDGDT